MQVRKTRLFTRRLCISKTFTTFASQFICNAADNYLNINKIKELKNEKQKGEANRHTERKEFADKAQMLEVLRDRLVQKIYFV